MRKLILELNPNEMIRGLYKPIFETFHSLNVLEMLRIDFEEGVKVGVMECITKENIPIHEVKLPDFAQILNILKSEGNKHTCIIKVQIPKEFTKLFAEFKLDLIWTTPLNLSEEKWIYSCIGDQESLTKFIELMKKYGEILNLRFQKAAYQEHDILSVLTEKQRDIIVAALKFGYYSYPKKINSEQLSQKVNISKATLLEHLRKAEARILENIIAG
jgi:hypothetical protein